MERIYPLVGRFNAVHMVAVQHLSLTLKLTQKKKCSVAERAGDARNGFDTLFTVHLSISLESAQCDIFQLLFPS